jgi:hypothetical protein
MSSIAATPSRRRLSQPTATQSRCGCPLAFCSKSRPDGHNPLKVSSGLDMEVAVHAANLPLDPTGGRKHHVRRFTDARPCESAVNPARSSEFNSSDFAALASLHDRDTNRLPLF